MDACLLKSTSEDWPRLTGAGSTGLGFPACHVTSYDCSMNSRYPAIWMALALAPLLSGCFHDASLSHDIRFDPATPQDAQQALVLMGVRISREPHFRTLFVHSYKPRARYLLTWRGIDETSHLNDIRREVQTCETSGDPLEESLDHCDPTLTQYRLMRVPAGRYVLSYFSAAAERLNMVTNFSRPVQHDILGSERISSTGDLDDAPGLSFAVGAGEIAYIGDLNWNADKTPARVTVSRDDRRAAAALASYPGITGHVVFRPVIGRHQSAPGEF